MLSAAQIIEKEYGHGGNFMTPSKDEYGKINEFFVYEISSGTFLEDKIFGLSIVEHFPETNTTRRCTKLSDCFQSIGALRLKLEEYKTVSVYTLRLLAEGTE